MSSFPKFLVYRQIIVNISKTMIDKTDLQKSSDSPGIAQVTFLLQN